MVDGNQPEHSSISARDVECSREWIEALSPRLLAWTRLRTRAHTGRMDAEDIVQEIWCRVLSKRDLARHRPPDGWVFQVAKFVLLECTRKAKVLSRVQIVDGHSSANRQLQQYPAELTTITKRMARREDMQTFLSQIEGLDVIDQRIYTLCGLEGNLHADVAVQLGMQCATVTKRWQRLRARLAGMNPPSGLV